MTIAPTYPPVYDPIASAIAGGGSLPWDPRGGGAPPWSPLDDPGLAKWWRADLGVGLSSGVVSSWTDQVTGESLTQGTASARPTPTTRNGLPVLSFDGGDSLQNASLTARAYRYFAIVIGELTGAGATQVMVDDGGGTANGFAFFYSAGNWVASAGSNLADTTAVAKTGNHVHILDANSGSSGVYYIDTLDSAAATGITGTATNDSMTVGANQGSAGPITGYVREIIVTTTVLSSTPLGYPGYLAWSSAGAFS